MTEDELVAALRDASSHRANQRPATREDVAGLEAACGYRLPTLLTRLLTEVTDGGFGPQSAGFGVSDMTGAALSAVDDEDFRERRWCLPLIDWGCAIMTMIDCRDPSGPLWGWDINLCCLDHALFPLDQTVTQMLEDSLTTEYPEPFYSGYHADLDHLRRLARGCAPLEWEKGRVKR